MKIRRTKVWTISVICLSLCIAFLFNRGRREPEVGFPDWNSVFGGIPTRFASELVPQTNRVKVLIGQRGIPETIHVVDENGLDEGWALRFGVHGTSKNGPFHVSLEDARQIKGNEYHGYFFRWEGLGGSIGPTSFGLWEQGQPVWGKFLVKRAQVSQGPGMSKAGSSPADRYVEISFGDAANHYIYFQDGKELASVGEFSGLDKQFQLELEADADFAMAASEVRSIAEEYLHYRLCRVGE